MTGFIIICLLIDLAFAATILGLIKSAKKGGNVRTSNLDDITSPSDAHSWHPLNMWNND